MAIDRTKHAMATILPHLPENAAIICANGYISREIFNIADRPGNFYMIGSMGLGASIAFGLAHSQPDCPVVIFDGDGNVLMGMGSLAMIGAYKLKNVYHFCFDNGVYASTGNQPSLSHQVSLEGVAAGAGYTTSARVDELEQLEQLVGGLFDQPGPSFVRVMVDPEPHPRTFARVSHTPVEIRDRFAGAVQAGR